MPEAKAELSSGNLENAFFELVRQAVRAEVQAILRRNEDRLLSIEEVAQTLSVSKDWTYRHSKKLSFTKKIGPKQLRFSEAGLQKWLRDKGADGPVHR